MIKTNNKDYVLLEQVSCIHYPLYFWKNIAGIKALIDLGSEVNVMTLIYTLKLGFKIHSTNIGVQKIDDSTLEIFRIVLTSFQVKNKLKKA